MQINYDLLSFKSNDTPVYDVINIFNLKVFNLLCCFSLILGK